MVTKHTSYRISEEGKQILKMLSKKLGVTDTAILEIAIRKFAEMEGVKVEQQDIETCRASNVDCPNS